MLWLIYTPLFAAGTAFCLFLAMRLSRRGWGRIPHRGDSVHTTVARALNATPTIDDAGPGWRLQQPEGVRIALPFHWEGLTGAAWVDEVGAADASELEAAIDGPSYRPQAAETQLKHFAFVARAPLAKVRVKSGSLPVGYGLPLELLSYFHTTENGMPLPAGDSGNGAGTWSGQATAGGGAQPPTGFELRESRVPKIVRRWALFDRDLSRLLQRRLYHDPTRAFVLTDEQPVWLEQPLWPGDSLPPAPFLIHLIEDEVQLLCVFPGYTPQQALSDPAWMAAQMRWFAEALPMLTQSALRAQKLASKIAAARKPAVQS